MSVWWTGLEISHWPSDVVGRGGETQLQVSEKLNILPCQDKGLNRWHNTLIQCWVNVGPTSVGDGGPTLTQHWVNVSCLLGYTGCIRDVGIGGCSPGWAASTLLHIHD